MSILQTIKEQVTADDIARAKEVVGCFVFGGADKNATLADARLALSEVADVLALLRITGYDVCKLPPGFIKPHDARPPYQR